MFNNRLLLSIQAGVMGILFAFIIASIPYVPRAFRKLGSTLGPEITIFLVSALLVFWMYIFFRERGKKAYLDSRIWLSLSAFLCFSLISFFLFDLNLIPVATVELDSLPTICAYVLILVGLVYFWVILISRRRKRSLSD